MKTGKVIQIIGAAVDVQFEQDHLPAIENAIEIEMDGGKKIVAEVAQQMGDGIVRCVSLESTTVSNAEPKPWIPKGLCPCRWGKRAWAV